MSVDRLTLGTVQFGLSYGIANSAGLPSDKLVEATLSEAANCGIEVLDCAASYGVAEARVGAFLRRQAPNDRFRVGSKLPKLPVGITGQQIEAWVDRALVSSLEHLGIECLESYLIHDATDLHQHGIALIEALRSQVDKGRVKHLGASIYEPEELALFDAFADLRIVQHPLNLLDQRLLQPNRLADLSAKEIRVHARSVFLQGLFSIEPATAATSARPTLTRLRSVLGDWETTPMEAALPFVVASGVDRILIGVDNPEQLQANLASIANPLPAELYDALRHAFAEVPIDLIDPRRW